MIVLNVNDIAFESAFAEWRELFEQSAKDIAEFSGGGAEKHDLTVPGAAETIAYRVHGKVGGKRHTVVTAYVVPQGRDAVIQFTAAGPDDAIDAEAVARSLRLEGG